MTDITSLDTDNQTATDSETDNQTPAANPFDAAPFYRKRWMIVVTALFFIPITLVILLTGPVYQNNGDVWDKKQRVTSAIALCCFMVFTFSRLLITPA
ncbi:MAG: hypothetical protein AB8G14_16535 [Ilumatobacter sp.]